MESVDLLHSILGITEFNDINSFPIDHFMHRYHNG